MGSIQRTIRFAFGENFRPSVRRSYVWDKIAIQKNHKEKPQGASYKIREKNGHEGRRYSKKKRIDSESDQTRKAMRGSCEKKWVLGGRHHVIKTEKTLLSKSKSIIVFVEDQTEHILWFKAEHQQLIRFMLHRLPSNQESSTLSRWQRIFKFSRRQTFLTNCTVPQKVCRHTNRENS